MTLILLHVVRLSGVRPAQISVLQAAEGERGGVGEPWDSEIHDVSGSGRQRVEQLQCVM